MQAVLVTRADAGSAAHLPRLPRALWPLLDRPFVQHVVESVVDIGAEVIHLLVDDAHRSLPSLLGDGRRWGVRLSYHPVGPRDCPYALAWKVVRRDGPVRWLLGHTDRLPCLTPPPEDGSSHLFWEESGWSGWAWLGAGEPEDLPRGLDEAHLGDLLGGPGTAGPVLGARSAAALLASLRAVLDGAFPGLAPRGRQVSPGVWLGRHARVHPTARLVPPVYVGEGALVRRGACLGPYVAVGSHSVLDRETAVEHAVLLPDTYLGPGLHLTGAVCDGPELEDASTGELVRIDEECILGRVSGGSLLEDVSRWWGALARLLRGSVTKPVGVVASWCSLPRPFWSAPAGGVGPRRG